MDSRGGYISKILNVKTKESGPLGGRAPGICLCRSANGFCGQSVASFLEGVAAECNPPHNITPRYDGTAKHYLGSKLLVIIKLNCTEIFYPKSANAAENAVNL